MTSGVTVKEKKVQTQTFFNTPCLLESFPHLPPSVVFSTSGLMFTFSFTMVQVVWKHLPMV